MAGTRSMGATLTMAKSGTEVEDLVLAHVASIGKITTKTGEIDVTTLDSPNNASEFIGGAQDSGSFDVVVNNLFDGQASVLESVFTSGETRAWTIAFMEAGASVATLAFNAFVIGREFGELKPEGLNEVTLTLRITGAPVYAEV